VPGVGHKVYGAQRWISIKKAVNFQPSEFAKIALILVLAWYGERYQRKMPEFFRGLIFPGCIIVFILALIFPEPDWGASLLLAAVSCTMLLLAGTRFLYFLPFIIAGCIGIYFLILNNPVRLARVVAWLDLEANKNGVGYQTCQSLVALGSGGWFGLGLGNGRQKLGYVPEHHTDFILSVIGEELGLVATLSVLTAFLVLIFCGFYIASKSKHQFGFLLGAGVTFLIGFQAFINIGVVTGVLPNKGLPLPFISYGGSNLLMMFICLGLLLNIARESCGISANKSELMPGGALVSSPY
jgi:cell division protein FtsW